MKRYALYALAALAALAVAFGAGRFSAPAKVVTETRWRDHVVEKRVEGPVRVVTITREAPARPAEPCPPSGICPACPAVHEGETTEDRGSTTTTTESDRTASSATVTSRDYPKLTIGVGAGVDYGNVFGTPRLTVLAAYRFAGPFSAWVTASKSQAAVGLGVQF